MKTGKKNSNSTDPYEARIAELFRTHVLAEARRLSEGNGREVLALDKDAASYYERPRHVAQLHFQIPDLDSPAAVAAEFRELWKDSPELGAMIPTMTELAQKLRSEQKDQSTELDSFIYVMY